MAPVLRKVRFNQLLFNFFNLITLVPKTTLLKATKKHFNDLQFGHFHKIALRLRATCLTRYDPLTPTVDLLSN